jgi:hypothetical protein
MSPAVAVVLSLVTGIGLELAVFAATGKREAWDAEVFWTIGLPSAMLIAFGIGFLATGRAWLATLAVAPGQFVAMTLRSGEIGSLWPFGLALSAFLSAPFVAAAFLGWKARAMQRRISVRRV